MVFNEMRTDYCGPIAPSGRILSPLKAGNNSISAEGAPLTTLIENRKKLDNRIPTLPVSFCLYFIRYYL